MSCRVLIISVLLWNCLAEDVAAKSIPSFVPLCAEHSANISECWKNSFNVVVPHLVDGIPEMKLWKIEPFLIESQTFRLHNKLLTVDSVLSNVLIYGMKDMKATHVDMDTDKVMTKLDVVIPGINMEGNFKASGVILDNAFNGNGFFIGNYSDLDIKTTWSGRKIIKNETLYAEMETGTIDMKIGKIKLKIDGLMPIPALNDHLNTVINDNIDVLYGIAKPVVEDTIREILLKAINNVHSFPFNVLYPKNKI